MKTVNTSFNFCSFLFFIFLIHSSLIHTINKRSHKAMKINNTTKRLSCLGWHTTQHNIYDTASRSFEMINNNHNNNDYKNDNVVCCICVVRECALFQKLNEIEGHDDAHELCCMRVNYSFYIIFLKAQTKVSVRLQKCIYVNCKPTHSYTSSFEMIFHITYLQEPSYNWICVMCEYRKRKRNVNHGTSPQNLFKSLLKCIVLLKLLFPGIIFHQMTCDIKIDNDICCVWNNFLKKRNEKNQELKFVSNVSGINFVVKIICIVQASLSCL